MAVENPPQRQAHARWRDHAEYNRSNVAIKESVVAIVSELPQKNHDNRSWSTNIATTRQ
jgi:hypothetical protein